MSIGIHPGGDYLLWGCLAVGDVFGGGGVGDAEGFEGGEAGGAIGAGMGEVLGTFFGTDLGGGRNGIVENQRR